MGQQVVYRAPVATGTLHGTADRRRPPMPQRAWSDKRERQYEHIKEGLEDRGRSEDQAEEIAARTVNKERARHGEAKTASRSSTDDISSGRRGGLRSHKGSGGPTRDQLYGEAKRRNIKGRSKMTKAQLARAVGR
jgi:plasmid stabilization system protein ParE